MPAQLHIDIVSDVACPWCAIGYKQLERAAALIADRVELSVRWHPFELAPDMPKDGVLLSDYMRQRYGATPEQGRASRDRIRAVGEPLGLEFNFTDQSRGYNTRRAHILLAWAGEEGGQTALKLALLKAYFTDQANVADEDVLLDAAEAAGLDREQARAALADPRYEAQIEAEEAHWREQNVSGVPAFFINGKYAIPGAQDAETWVRVIDKVIEREALAT